MSDEITTGDASSGTFEPDDVRVVASEPAVSNGESLGSAVSDGESGGEPEGESEVESGSDTPGESGPRPPGTQRKRRRGSRGGRNRKRPAGSQGAQTSGAQNRGAQGETEEPAAEIGTAEVPGEPSVAPEEDSGRRGHDENAAADRGLTTEDLAQSAMEDAGLRAPRIGDTRPAPVSAPVSTPASTPASSQKSNSTPSQQADGSENSEEGQSASDGTSPPRKRRRRGGKGRGRGGSRPTGTGGTSGAVVTADLNDDGTSVLDTLDEETLERRRGRTRKGRPTGRYQMVVRVDADGTIQMAVLEGRMLVEHYVSRKEDDAASIDGNIYLGKVQNVLPGMEAAFVDIGTPKNGVIYQRDVQFDASVVEGADQAGPKIETVLRNGQSILVQVTKNPIGAKGARLTQEVSLAGRFVVLVPGQPTTYGISKRLPDDERKRLRKVLEGLRPVDAGLIVRTAAEGATADELQRDVARLQNQWEQISALAARSKPGSLLYREPALVVRVIREEFTKEYRSIVIDDEAMFADVKSYVDAIAPELSERVEFYEEKDLPVFERFHVHEQLHKALDRKVWLPSGGSLIIERTEALTVIDVNTGKNVGRTNLEETVFANNVEAAGEIGRQLRLRDIGGIIVIDFIDMEIRKNRDEVVRALKEALSRDKTRTQVFDISDLGLVEMTRKRISEGLVEAFSETCTVCGGRGFTVDESML